MILLDRKYVRLSAYFFCSSDIWKKASNIDRNIKRKYFGVDSPWQHIEISIFIKSARTNSTLLKRALDWEQKISGYIFCKGKPNHISFCFILFVHAHCILLNSIFKCNRKLSWTWHLYITHNYIKLSFKFIRQNFSLSQIIVY